MSHIRKKGVQFFESYSKKFNSLSMFKKYISNSLSNMEKRVQVFESYFKMGSILWFIFLKRKMVQFFKTCSKVGSISMSQCWKKKKGSKLWVMLKRMQDSILWVMLNWRVQFSESYEKNSILWVMFGKGSIIWLIFQEKSSILGVILKKSQCLESFFTKKIHWITFKEKVQFFE